MKEEKPPVEPTLPPASSDEPQAHKDNQGDEAVPENKAANRLSKPSHLRLVISNPPTPASHHEKPLTPPQGPLPGADFSVKMKKLGGVYKLVVQDHFHGLGNEFYVEVEKRKKGKVAICHLPTLLEGANPFLDQDETLYGVIAVQFQLKLLKQFFLFCRKFRASKLILYIENEQAEGFGVYHNFLGYYNEGLVIDAKETEMVIPAHRQAFTFFRQFMAESIHQMEQGLWHDQKTNLAIRYYLKSRIRHGWE